MEGAWTTHPTRFDNGFFILLFPSMIGNCNQESMELGKYEPNIAEEDKPLDAHNPNVRRNP